MNINHKRRIQIVGNRSYSISLPKDWVTRNGLTNKDSLNIKEFGSKLIISRDNDKTNENSLSVKINNLDKESLSSMIFLFYKKGVSSLKLVFNNKSEYLDSKMIIGNILSKLDGFRICEEENNNIVIKSLYGKSDIGIVNLAKRMTSIINQAVESLKNSSRKTREILENEIDSLYHLSERDLYICSTDENIRLENGILDIEEIFLWRTIFKKFEGVADIIEKIIGPSEEVVNNLDDLLEKLNNIFILHKKPNSNLIYNMREKRYKKSEINKINELIIDAIENMFLINLNKEYFKK